VIDWVVEPRWRALLSANQATEMNIGSRVEELSSLQPLANRLHFAPTRDWRNAPLSRQTWQEVKTLRKALQAMATMRSSICKERCVRCARANDQLPAAYR